MARVFVSHASEDTPTATMLHGWLRADGHDVFLDRDLRDGLVVGEEWEQRLHERLRWADAVVCVVSSAYTGSVWCTAEVAIARSRGCRLLPVTTEAGATHPLLPQVQYVDVVADGHRARAGLAEALTRVDAAGGEGWADDRSPFPGLRAFTTDEHRVFFGREDDVNRLAAVLRSPAERSERAVLLVVGPSGSGKSSLVRAGLVPLLADESDWWPLPPFLPGPDPYAALVRELATAARSLGRDWTLADVRHRLEAGGLAETADELLLAVPGRRRSRRLLVVVDQFEEVLTQAAPSDRARFAALLRSGSGGPVQVVATLRPEFLDRLLVDPELGTLPKRVHPLEPLRREALRTVIEKPAGLARIAIDEGLVDRLVTDTDRGEALPLLAYALSQLAEGVGHGGRLRTARYEQLGGVDGALTRQADEALDAAVAAGGRTPEQVVKELLRLVTVDEQGSPTRWRVPYAELPPEVAAELDAFVDRRLLTTQREDDRVVIGVAHEAFLSAWAPLDRATKAASTGLRARRLVEQAARDWTGAGRPPLRLWGSGQLAAAWLDTGARFVPRRSRPPDGRRGGRPARWPRRGPAELVADVELSATAREFLATSARRDRRNRWRLTTFLSVMLVLALSGAAVAWVQRGAAQQNQRAAVARQLVAQADAARATDARTALLLGIAAQRLQPDAETGSSLVDTLTHTRYLRTLPHADGVVGAAYARDGRTLATGGLDGTIVLWDVADPTRPRRLGDPTPAHNGYVYSVEFSPDGHTLATAGADTTVLLWDVTDPAHPRRLGAPLTGHTAPVHYAAFSPDGRTLATGGFDQVVLLWDVSDPTRPRRIGEPLTGQGDRVTMAAFSPDGRTLASAGFDHVVLLWDVSDPARPRRIGAPLAGHDSAVWGVTFSPDGHMLATAGADARTVLWDVTDLARPRRLGEPLTGHTGEVYSVAFAPDGRTLATASTDRTVLLWDVTDPARPRRLGDPLTGHADYVNTVAFAPDGRTLATASLDRTVVLWDVAGPVRPQPLGEPLTGNVDRVYAVAFAPAGQMLAAAGGDAVLVTDTRDPAHPRQLARLPTGATRMVAFSPDGRTLATAGVDGGVQLWDLTVPDRPQRRGPVTADTDPVFTVAFSPDGRTLATGGADGTVGRVLLWDVTDPAHPQRRGPPLTGYAGAVFTVAFSPDRRTLATSGADRSVLLWDVADPDRPRRLGPPVTEHASSVYALAFSPDGRMLASGGADRTVLLWDVADPTRPQRLGPPLVGHAGYVYSVAFAPDGATVAGGGADGTVVLWDVTDPPRPRQLGEPLAGRFGAINAVAFAPDAPVLAAGGGDAAVRLWDLGPLRSLQTAPTERACALAGRGLDGDEWSRYVSGLAYRDTCAP